MIKYRLKDLVQRPISGEWGDDDLSGDGVLVLRTTNFTKTGEVDYSNVVRRLIDPEKIESKKLQVGDLIIEKSGGGPKTPVGRVILFEKKETQPYLCNNFTAILRPKTELVNSKYLLYQFLHLYQIGKVKQYQNQTTGLYNLKLDRYLSEEIQLPDLSIQEKVVAYLDRVRELINKRVETIQFLDEYIHSVFLELFLENSLKWEYIPLGKSNGIKSRIQGIGKKSNDTFNGKPMIRMNNLSYSGEIILDDLKFIELSELEERTFHLENRNVLFNRTNSPELVGKIAVWDKGDGYTFAGYLVRLELDEDILNPYYLSSFFNSNFGKKVLRNKARLSGNLANISGSKFLDQLILIPPINLQREYEEIYLKFQKQKSNLKIQSEILTNFFQAYLQSAFSEESQIDEYEIFESLLQNFTKEDLKQGKRLNYLIDWINCEEPKFSKFESYDLAWARLRELLEDGSIEQTLKENEIKLKVAK